MKTENFKNYNVAVNGNPLSHYKTNLRTSMVYKKDFIKNNTFYLLEPEHEIHFDDKTVLLIKRGSIKDPTPKLLEIDTLNEVENQRKPNQLEPELKYMIIDYRLSKIFHNTVTKDFMKDYINEKTNVPKSEMSFTSTIDREEFIKSIETVQSLSFTMADNQNLFAQQNPLYSELTQDFFGYGMETMKVEMKMSNTQKSKSLKEKMITLLGGVHKGSQCDYKTIKIIGKDENGFEQVFNKDHYVYNVQIDVPETLDPSIEDINYIISQYDRIIMEMNE